MIQYLFILIDPNLENILDLITKVFFTILLIGMGFLVIKISSE